MDTPLVNILERNQHLFHPVVPFDPASDRLLAMDFSEANTGLPAELFDDVGRFTDWVQQQQQAYKALYGIGGYAEERAVYSRSRVFDAAQGGEPRRLHLGVDIWGPAGTPVYAPLGGMVHSFAMNNRPGDYGATINLLHQLDGYAFYTLYGHVSEKDLALVEGKYINRGEQFAHLGRPTENGGWPPHLHFQIIIDLQEHNGDYPGVCSKSEKEIYLSNCPDPDLILQMRSYAINSFS